VSLRAGCISIFLGLLAAVGLFAWSEAQAGRSPLWLISGITPTSTPRAVVVVPTATSASSAPRPAEPSAMVTPTGPATATPSPASIPTPRAAPTSTAPLATATPRPTALPPSPPQPTARQVGITLEELDRELKQTLAGSGAPLRNPRLRFQPPDAVGLAGGVPVSIFQIPVEIEARLSVDERGQVKVTTTRVQAVGATLPDGVTAELGRRIDEQGTRAIADALPPAAVARRVVVEPDRIRVELTS
jgi:hypothetical protein